MSKPSTAQIIALGDYLEPDFNPASLTVAHLLGILGFHNVKYPSQYTKAKLVQLFDDEIKSKSSQFKKERLSRQNSLASDEGITDGMTGQALNTARKGPTTRGASRRSSVQPSAASVVNPPRPEPVKRRRSTVEPTVAPTRRRRVTQAVEILAEESEAEDVEVRKVSRNTGSSAEAGTEARRVAHTRASEDIDSGWEDNNVFQSGAESSSPARPSPVRPRTRRSSVGARKQRKSMSEPPQFLVPPGTHIDRSSRRASDVKPPESAFLPSLPDEVLRSSNTRSIKRRTDLMPDNVSPHKVNQEVIEVPSDTEGRKQLSQVAEEGSWVEQDANPETSSGHLQNKHEAVAPEPEDAVSDSELIATDEQPGPESQGQEQDRDALSQKEYEETVAVSQRIADGGQVVRRKSKPSSAQFNILRFLLAFVGVGTLTSFYQYKTESAPIGFCNTDTRTNEVLEGLRHHRAAVDECNQQNRTLLFPPQVGEPIDAAASPSPASEGQDAEDSQLVLSELCPAPPMLPIPVPDSCAPCPAYASCTSKSMTCDTGYLLRPHPLLSFLSPPRAQKATDSKARNTYTLPAYMQHGSSGDTSVSQSAYWAISAVLDGLPGFGPVAFPPRCVEDPRRKRHIGALGKTVEAKLAAERGRRQCAGVGWKEQPGTPAAEAEKWGLEVEALKEEMKAHLRKKASSTTIDGFEDTWNEAIEQLIVWGGVFIGEDAKGKRYLAHRSPQMDLACTVKVKARQSWEEWRKVLLLILALAGSTDILRRRRLSNANETERVAVLAQSALNLLRSQELAHYTDPVTAPHPFLPSLQLRDLVLQDEPSIRTRRRLWARVARIVEGNTNVRTNLEEVEGGSEERVWRWVGSAGKSLPQSTDEAA